MPVQTSAPFGYSTVTGQPLAAPTPGGTPQEIYQGFRAQKRELSNQLEQLESTQRDIVNQLQEPRDGRPALNAVNQKLLEQRLTDVNARITATEKAIADADAQVATAAAVPGATREPPRPPRTGPPEEAFVLGGIFIVVVMLPLSIAFARRIWRRGARIVQLPKELNERLTGLDQAVESIAVEVERIGEAQRFMTNVMTEQGGARALGAGMGAAPHFEVRERQTVRAEG